MYIMMEKDLITTLSTIVYIFRAEEYSKVIDEFTEKVRSWLVDDNSGSFFYRKKPRPAFYNYKGQIVLSDDESISQYKKGNCYYYISELTDENYEEM